MPAESLPPPPVDIPCRSCHRRRRWLVTTLALLIALAACGSDGASTKGAERDGMARTLPDKDQTGVPTPGATAPLSDLTALGQLEQLFNQHQDVPRLLLLLSPT